MRLLRLMAVLTGALGISSCFPDYQVEQSGSGSNMSLIPAAGQPFGYTYSSGAPFSVSFTHSFRIDHYEVTVRRYRDWVESGMEMPCKSGTCSLDQGGPYEAQMVWDSAWNTLAGESHYNLQNGQHPDCQTPVSYQGGTTWGLGQAQEWQDLPMTCVSWFQAAAFCSWDAGRLPTEAEWVYTATNHGTTLAVFPWGDSEPTCTQAVVQGCGWPTQVGSAWEGATVDGVQDLVGSVFEWVWDMPWTAPLPNKAPDWAGPEGPLGAAAENVKRVRHGGAYIYPKDKWEHRNDANEIEFSAIDFFGDHGFRCARTMK